MPAQPTSRLRSCLPALLAGIGLAAIAATPARAQSASVFSCTNGALLAATDIGPDRRPVPRILRYAVAAGTDATPVGALREAREATVTGGDAERGWLRIDVTFDSAIPRDCRLPLTLTVAADRGNPADRAVQEQLARLLDGMEIVAGRTDMMAHLVQAVAFAGNGTDTASFRIPIRATTTSRTDTHALKLVLAQNYGAGLPLSVNVAPLPAFAVAPVSGPLSAGASVLVRAEHPVPLLPGTAAMPVTFSLSPATLGRWRDAPSPSSGETRGGWDTRFTPIRAEAALVPATLAQSASGTVSIGFAGQTRTVPVTVAASAAPAGACDPVFAVAAAPGGLRVSMTNRGAGVCPAHVVTPRGGLKPGVQLSPAQASITAPRAAAPALRPGGPVAVVKPGVTPLPLIGGDAGATFTLAKQSLSQLGVGTLIEFDIAAEGTPAAATKQRASIRLSAADIAVITGRKSN